MRQLNLDFSQIETLLRALSNEAAVDRDLESRRALTVDDLQRRAAERRNLAKVLRSSLETGETESLDLIRVKTLIDETLDRFVTGLAFDLCEGQPAALRAVDSEPVQAVLRETRAKLYKVTLETLSRSGIQSNVLK
jgi:hypothetical protein